MPLFDVFQFTITTRPLMARGCGRPVERLHNSIADLLRHGDQRILLTSGAIPNFTRDQYLSSGTDKGTNT